MAFLPKPGYLVVMQTLAPFSVLRLVATVASMVLLRNTSGDFKRRKLSVVFMGILHIRPLKTTIHVKSLSTGHCRATSCRPAAASTSSSSPVFSFLSHHLSSYLSDPPAWSHSSLLSSPPSHPPPPHTALLVSGRISGIPSSTKDTLRTHTLGLV